MRVIDISQKLNEKTVIYEGDPRFRKDVRSTVSDNGYMISALYMGTHTGTHVDAPCHFIEGGRTVSELPVKTFVGPCLVSTDMAHVDVCGKYERVLFKSAYANRKLSLEEAQRLVDARVSLVGTDMLSIGDDKVHRLLLGNGCVILEGLVLSNVEEREYFLSAAPLKMDTDGSHMRYMRKNFGI